MKRLLSLLLVLAIILPQNGVLANESQNLPTIIVNKSINTLAYFENGKLLREFRVATGSSNQQTPEGRYRVVDLKTNPSYIPQKLPGGHKDNPLGSHWIGINHGNTQGQVFGIHGTNKPSIIGNYTNQGTVSMKNEDIRLLYERLNTVPKVNIGGVSLPNVNVIIVSSTKSFEEILKGPTKVDPPIPLFINGERQVLDQDPVLINSRAMVPMRFIFEKIGATVQWEAKEKRIIATKGDKRLQLVVGSKVVRINGVEAAIDTPPVIINNRTLVPLRYIFEEFGTEVEWDSEKRAIYVKQVNLPVTFFINDVAQSIIGKSEIIYGARVPFTDQKRLVEELLVPAPFIFEKFGATMEYNAYDKKLVVTRNEQRAELIVGSKQMKLNGKIELLNHAPTLKGGQVLVPLDVMQRLFGATRKIENYDKPLREDLEPIIDLNYKLNQFIVVYFNGNVMLPYTGFVVDQAQYLPLSLVFRELRADVDAKDGEIKIFREGTLIQMHVDSQSAFVNGNLVRVDAPPRSADGQIIVPLKFVSEALGARVISTGNKIYINQQ